MVGGEANTHKFSFLAPRCLTYFLLAENKFVIELYD